MGWLDVAETEPNRPANGRAWLRNESELRGSDTLELNSTVTLEEGHARIVSQLDGVSPVTRQLLLEIALCDPPAMRFDIDEKALSEDGIVGGLVPAMKRRLVSIDVKEREVVFAHPSIRSVVIELSTPEERRRAHRVLASTPRVHPNRRLWHLAACTVEPNEEVAKLLAGFAEKLVNRGEVKTAVVAMDRAARLTPLQEQRNQRLMQSAYWGLAEAGHLDRADSFGTGHSSPDHMLWGAAVSARLLLKRGGHVETAHGLLVRSIRQHGRYSRDTGSLVEAVRTLTEVCVWASRRDLWGIACDVTRELGSKLPADVQLLTQATGSRAPASACALDELADMAQRAEKASNLREVVRVASVLSGVDRLSGCKAALWQAVSSSNEGESVILQIGALTHLCVDAFTTGQWTEAHDLAKRGVSLCEGAGQADLEWLFRYRLGLIAVARGDADYCRESGRQIARCLTSRGFVAVQKAIHHIDCLSASGLGDFEDAYQQAAAISPAGEFPSQNPFALSVAMDLVEAAIRTGRIAEAEAHVDGMKRAGLADISPRLELVMNASSAMVLRTSNDSCRMFEKALCVPGAESYPFELSRVELCYGEHLRRCRKVVESRVHLTEAVQRFRSLGASPWAVRAESELQAAEGARTRCTTTGVGSLTPQELEVARLAASGLTNKEIGKRLMVSHRTVSAHLYRVFPKLAVRSRAALRDALTDE